MCGICGKYSSTGPSEREIRRMTETLRHRGPDDEGYYFDGPVGLGHRRLSIIDIERGAQPLSNEDRSVWIVYNGEIYNFPELKKELENKGHKFRTHTDTEVIVHLYEEYGIDCVKRLSGMFAFAIWDQPRHRLFLARDRTGQKPLFYRIHGNEFLFASEVKAILAADGVSANINLEAVSHYLTLRFIPPPLTLVETIHKLPAGHAMTYDGNEVRVFQYWDLDFRRKLRRDDDQIIEQMAEELERAVSSHLISDVPLGAFLSGGMDTSTVVALMAKKMSSPFPTFAIGVEEDDFNELPYAQLVAQRFGTNHIERVVHAGTIELLPTMIWHLDEPSDPIAACMFQAAQLASEHVKVVLGGDGGDELFAGFDRYRGVGLIDYYAQLPSIIREKLIRPVLKSLSDSFSYKSLPQKLRWMDQLSEYQGGRRYAEATAFFRFAHTLKKQLFEPSVWRTLQHCVSTAVIESAYEDAPAEEKLDRMLYADFKTRLPEHTLMLTDRMNMARSLEARSPFLDHRLVEFMASVPSELKIRGKELKYILRRFAESLLPPEIIRRPKQGFMLPVAYWFRSELLPLLRGTVQQSHFVRNGVFREAYIKRLIDEHAASKVDHHVRLWMLLNLELWHRIYVEGAEPEALGYELGRLRNAA